MLASTRVAKKCDLHSCDMRPARMQLKTMSLVNNETAFSFNAQPAKGVTFIQVMVAMFAVVNGTRVSRRHRVCIGTVVILLTWGIVTVLGRTCMSDVARIHGDGVTGVRTCSVFGHVRIVDYRMLAILACLQCSSSYPGQVTPHRS